MGKIDNVKKTTPEFINKSKLKHGDKYDYSLVEYINCNTKIKIICPIHGIFEQDPNHHYKYGCKKCSNNILYENKDFIEKANFVHNNKYDYSKVNYKNAHIKVEIVCSEHGVFEQKPNSHLMGYGCSSCGGNKKLTNDVFIKKSNIIHNNKYDYSLVNYKNNRTKVKIICPKHDIFKQTPSNHLTGHGCSKCYNSIGEKFIENYFIDKKILYEPQKKFNGCKYKYKLKFDFYLPNKNCCIEFDGKQHFEKYNFEKNNDRLENRKKRDQIKNIYCQENNIKLHRIKYSDNLIEKLNEILNDY